MWGEGSLDSYALPVLLRFFHSEETPEQRKVLAWLPGPAWQKGLTPQRACSQLLHLLATGFIFKAGIGL